MEEWYISGCIRCIYTEHTPNPRTHCPNCREPLMRMPGLIGAWKAIEFARKAFAVETAKRQYDHALRDLRALSAVG